MSVDLLQEANNIIVKDELSFATVPHVFNQLITVLQKKTDVVFDFSAVTECDSASIVLLTRITDVAKKQSVNVSFVNLPRTMLTLIALYNLTSILDIR
jgi:ABC-type transporter Mla MlaB component